VPLPVHAIGRPVVEFSFPASWSVAAGYVRLSGRLKLVAASIRTWSAAMCR